MSADTTDPGRYVDSRYAAKLDRFAEERDVSRAISELAFRRHCEAVRGSFEDDAPADAIRRVAFHKLELDRLDPAVEVGPRASVEATAVDAAAKRSRE